MDHLHFNTLLYKPKHFVFVFFFFYRTCPPWEFFISMTIQNARCPYHLYSNCSNRNRDFSPTVIVSGRLCIVKNLISPCSYKKFPGNTPSPLIELESGNRPGLVTSTYFKKNFRRQLTVVRVSATSPDKPVQNCIVRVSVQPTPNPPP